MRLAFLSLCLRFLGPASTDVGRCAQALRALGSPCHDRRAHRRAPAAQDARRQHRHGASPTFSPTHSLVLALVLTSSPPSRTQIISLTINPRSDSPDDLFTLLDKQLIAENPAGQTVLHLLTAVPDLILCHLDRQLPALTSLDGFGASSAAAAAGGSGGPNAHHDAKRVFRPTPTGHEDVWLDRYWVKNRVRVAAARAEQARLERERDELRATRDEVARTDEGKDARELVRGTVEYLRRATAEGDDEREARQRRLREQWEKVGEELEAVIDSASLFL